ncbi:hypothetical protein ES692_14925 [Psychroserpens burtonensis]|uniref:Uncharacterized protein n=1 Tax=Psychroserpens burtonensis TaxID=49278 RepID=A0A5C7B5P7_9FLAO|nr:hypothetical protein [Psychroserpens burtonensis]TXE15911.1 hypothetical protein ES692_14925 [Psychroserpens burtonensis]
MTRLLYILICFIAFQTQLAAQVSLNSYKYIIVPKQFDFLNSQDQYQTSSLTKFLFNKYGYTAFFDDDDLPQDLSENRCLGLKSDIKKIKGFLITKLQIDLIDCNGNIVISSDIGETKVKEYKKSYQIAIRDAFTAFQSLDYNYIVNEDITVSERSNTNASEVKQIEQLKKEVELLKAKNDKVQPISEVKERVVPNTVKNLKEGVKEVVNETVIPEIPSASKPEILYAQPIDNGFQIVDTQPKKVMILLNTGTPNIYIVKGKDAIVYNKEGSWVYALYNEGNLELSVINLKF